MIVKEQVVALIQARMGSTRLPGKVMADIAGKPMLWHVVNRARHSNRIDRVVVATSSHSCDDVVASFCDHYRISCFRGNEQDVLDRFYQAASHYRADIVVRITADCPLIDPEIIDLVIEARAATGSDYATNSLRDTFPNGLDVEVFTFAALERAWQEAKKPSEREHVTPYIRYSGEFQLWNVLNEEAPWAGRQRWTVDDPADLEFVRGIYQHIGETTKFAMRDVLALLEKHPSLRDAEGKATKNEGYYRSLFQQAKAGPAPQQRLNQSEELLYKAKKVIPGFIHQFGKDYTLNITGNIPIFLARGKGARVWDVDGNEYLDYGPGVQANILGHAHEAIIEAAQSQSAMGNCLSLPHSLEVALAEKLTRLIPCAEMVCFGNKTSDASKGAILLAQAFTGRNRIARCSYPGFKDCSTETISPTSGLQEKTPLLPHPFLYNDPSHLKLVLNSYPNEFAAILLQPACFSEPAQGYFNQIFEIARRNDLLVIFDETCSGFLFGLGGMQKRYNIKPDLAFYGNSLGNGFPISCIVGRAAVMNNFHQACLPLVFETDLSSIAAALKVIDMMENSDAMKNMEENGRRLKDGFNVLSKIAGLFPQIECIGYPSISTLKFQDPQGNYNSLVHSLFVQECLKRGLIIQMMHSISAAHDADIIERTLQIYAVVLKTLADWLSDSDPARYLEVNRIAYESKRI